MSGKNTAVFGIYPSYANVESGVDGLKAAGFSNRDISVLFPESAGSKDFAHEKGTKAPEGATAGAGTRSGHRRHHGMAAGHRRARDSWTGAVHRGRPNHGSSRRSWCGWRGRWHYRSPGRHGHSRIRGQALRGPREERRHPVVGAFRQLRGDHKRAKQILEATGAQDISSTSETSSDDTKTDKDLRRAS